MKFLLTVLLLLVFACIGYAEPVSLSLAEAIKMAVEKNLNVRAELYNPAQFEADINRNRGIYDPLLAIQGTFTDATTAYPVAAGPSSAENRILLLNSSLSQLFWSGGTVSLNFNNSYTDTNSQSQLNDYWQSTIGVTLSQPLLRNLGRENTELAITVSRLSKFASLEHFNTLLVSIISQVRNEYFKLHSLRDDLEVKKVSLELAQKILNETRARVKAGVLPAMEILNAEFGAATREKDLIDAEKSLSDQIDILRLLLQVVGSGEIMTSDIPQRTLMEVSEEKEIRLALERPDIRELKKNLAIAELQTRVFNNKTKPDLTLSSSFSTNGLDRTYPRTLDRFGTFDYPVWGVGLTFSYPLGNRAAENDYRKSRLKIDQIALQIKGVEESAIKDVRAAIRAITAGYKQIDVAERGRAYAEERLKAFIRKNEVGLATTKDVLDVENDLAVAKSNLIKAVVTYNNAITLLWQATGEILEREGVRVVEESADKLYRNIH